MRGRGGAWVSNAAKADNQMRIDRRAAEYAHQMGLTVYLDDVMAALTGATEFCRALEADLGLQEGAIAVFRRTAGSTVRWAATVFLARPCNAPFKELMVPYRSCNHRDTASGA